MDHVSPDESNFSCDTVKDGIYADVESDCRKFYVCEKTVKYHFSCPLGMRFYQRFETCSYIPPEEEATFNCNEMTSHEGRSLKSQSLNSEEISEDTESHDLERRDDQSTSDEVVVPEHTSDQLASLLLQPQLSQGHFPELTFLTDEQGPAYLIFDHEELVPKSQERHHQEQQESPQHPQHQLVDHQGESINPIHSNSDVSTHQVPSATYSLCQLAKLRTKRDLRCV